MSGAAVTIWERGRLDARVGPRQVLFGRMYEDASIELEVFRPGGRVLCIASAGCTAMRLAQHHEVVAVDINPVQLEYAARRIGGDPGFRGRAEKVMDFMRFFAPLAGWWPSQVREFVGLSDPSEQMDFWNRKLNTWRFRAALDGLFSITALRAVYAPRFLDFLPKRLGKVMRGRMERCFSRHPNSTNRFARSLLLGELDVAPAPPQADRIKLVHADAAVLLENEPPGSFDGFTLSNILDGVDDAYRRRLYSAVKRTAAPGAITVIRSFGEVDAGSPRNRAADDRSMLWGTVLVRPVEAL
jgi:S-adenosylmethionine:diacylglycerol 3-amino-3-carboxypropyl transferase